MCVYIYIFAPKLLSQRHRTSLWILDKDRIMVVQNSGSFPMSFTVNRAPIWFDMRPIDRETWDRWYAESANYFSRYFCWLRLEWLDYGTVIWSLQPYLHLRDSLKICIYCIWTTFDGSDDQSVMYDLAESLLVRLAGRNSYFSAWHGSQFIANLWLDNAFCPRESMFGKAPSHFCLFPKTIFKETYFWDNFDYNVRCYDFGYQENLDANFGRGWCIRPKWWIPALILAFHAASLWMQYEDVDTNNMHANLGGGFKYLLFSSLFGEHSHFE